MFLKRFRLKGLVDESKLTRMTGEELETRVGFRGRGGRCTTWSTVR